MQTNCKMKNIQFRVTAYEKEQIELNASLLGTSISTYCRDFLLNPGTDISGRLAQRVAAALCQHAAAVNKLPPSTIRDNLTQWEKEVWQLLK